MLYKYEEVIMEGEVVSTHIKATENIINGGSKYGENENI